MQVAKIERRLEKERTKSLIGRKLHDENQRLLKNGPREVLPHAVKTSLHYENVQPVMPQVSDARFDA